MQTIQESQTINIPTTNRRKRTPKQKQPLVEVQEVEVQEIQQPLVEVQQPSLTQTPSDDQQKEIKTKSISAIIKESGIPPQRKLNVFIDPQPVKTPDDSQNYYTYHIKDISLQGPNGIKKITKDHIPEQITLSKAFKNIYENQSDTLQLIYDTTAKTYKKGDKFIKYYPFTYDFI